MQKYRYALDSENKLVDVEILTKINHEKFYKCISCGEPLISKLGNVRIKHFCHKKENNSCSYETYLHRASKFKLYKYIKDNIDNNKPLLIELEQEIICSKCMFDFSKIKNCIIDIKINEYDLLKRYTQVLLEKKIDNLVPDILLANSDFSDYIFIEIFVTHKSEVNKIETKSRIIEIKVENEEDIKELENPLINHNNLDIRLINFNVKPIKRILVNKNECIRCNNGFYVYKSGKSIYTKFKYGKYQSLKPKIIYFKEYDENYYYHPDRYIKDVIEAYNNKIDIKNCHLCRYHGFAKKHPNSASKKIFCKYYKETKTSNFAADCSIYKPDEKSFTDVDLINTI